MIDDESGFSCAGLLGGLAMLFALCCGFVIGVNLTTGQTIVIDTTMMPSIAQWFTEVGIPGLTFSLAFVVGLTVGFTFVLLVGDWILKRAENAAAGLALALEDTRKKKRDEYDAYYDARLDEASYEPDTNIAYYEDGKSTQEMER